MPQPTNRHPLQLPIKNTLLNSIVSRVLGIRPLVTLYNSWLRRNENQDRPVGDRFLDFSLSYLDTRVQWTHNVGLERVPSEGPFIMVSNHPLGCLEGMLLSHELLKVRKDTKVLANELLLRFPEFNELFIGLDVLSNDAARRNTRGIRAACKHLDEGGALLIFPAGTVSTINLRQRRIEDRQWNKLVGRLARRYHAACLPVYVNARNSLPFYLTGLIHPRLRTLLLARQLANKRGCTISATAGELLTPRDLNELDSDAAVTDFLRLSNDALGPDHSENRGTTIGDRSIQIAGDMASSALQARLDKLVHYRLVDDQIFSVYCAPYAELGCMMNQIAIERERSFRAVGEGTGRELDSDDFDPHYWHLWAWDKQQKKIVGAYRVGKTDEIIREQGVDCLYSHSLYQFDSSFVGKLVNSIEVGRSFVALDYQRQPKALDLLWRGIGSFIAKTPGYHTLFGCVSISSEYSSMARAFLADAMMTNFAVGQDVRQQVRPRSPFQVSDKPWSAEILKSLNSIAIINKLLGNLDQGKRMPILLRHYLALNGRFASFTVNRGFNDSLDGLIFVDLRQAPDKYLNRYLGKEGTALFLQYWSDNVRAA